MATFAIGDVHGCLGELRSLLDQIEFRPGRDRLWLVGDLVNGGPHSLEVLRWAHRHRGSLVSVLGNHDLYALARFAGTVRRKKRDTLDALLAAPDAGELMDWLRRRPLLHLGGDRLLVHAGLAPQWSVDEAGALAGEVQADLRGPGWKGFLKDYFNASRRGWTSRLQGRERLLAALRIFTMIRTCKPAGRICFDFSGPPEEAPDGCLPWYRLRPPGEPKLLFGHWAALGYRELPNGHGLDSGLVWGGKLTALRLGDGRVFQIDRCSH